MLATQYFFIKVLESNYIWLLVLNGEAIAIDCGDAEPLYNFLKQHNLTLKYVLVTHSHYDHVNGLQKIKQLTNAKIIAGGKTADIIKNSIVVDNIIKQETEINLLGLNFKVLFTPGHINDHVVYYETNNKWLFSGDTLFSLGVGRVFEGKVEVLKQSLEQIKQLPKETLIFAGHEYTASNLKFVKSLGFFNNSSNTRSEKFTILAEQIEQKQLNNNNTLPSILQNELQFNPFLNANNQEFKTYLNKQHLIDDEFFVYLRAEKDNF